MAPMIVSLCANGGTPMALPSANGGTPMAPSVLSAVVEYRSEAFLVLGFLVFRFRHGHILFHCFDAFGVAWMGAHEIADHAGFGILAETRPELDGCLWIVACSGHQN